MAAPILIRLGFVQTDTDREFSANFDRQASATNSVSFVGLSPPKACKTVSFFVSFHRGATQSGILFLVSIERGTSRRVYHRRPWLSDMSQLGGALWRFLARPGCERRARSEVTETNPADGRFAMQDPRTCPEGTVDAYLGLQSHSHDRCSGGNHTRHRTANDNRPVGKDTPSRYRRYKAEVVRQGEGLHWIARSMARKTRTPERDILTDDRSKLSIGESDCSRWAIRGRLWWPSCAFIHSGGLFLCPHLSDGQTSEGVLSSRQPLKTVMAAASDGRVRG